MALHRQRPLIRPHLRALYPYVPGEQPKVKGLIKLNTNENPHPPSAQSFGSDQAAVDERLRLYPIRRPSPCGKSWPGSTDANPGTSSLAMAPMSCWPWRHGPFVEPRSGAIQYFTPSYSLYPVLADIHRAAKNALPCVRTSVCHPWPS